VWSVRASWHDRPHERHTQLGRAVPLLHQRAGQSRWVEPLPGSPFVEPKLAEETGGQQEAKFFPEPVKARVLRRALLQLRVVVRVAAGDVVRCSCGATGRPCGGREATRRRRTPAAPRPPDPRRLERRPLETRRSAVVHHASFGRRIEMVRSRAAIRQG
jgi:hypothetical protein